MKAQGFEGLMVWVVGVVLALVVGLEVSAAIGASFDRAAAALAPVQQVQR